MPPFSASSAGTLKGNAGMIEPQEDPSVQILMIEICRLWFKEPASDWKGFNELKDMQGRFGLAA
jgi:hypothetical protein